MEVLEDRQLLSTAGNHQSKPSSTTMTVDLVAPQISLTAPATGTAGTPMDFAAGALDLSPSGKLKYIWTFGDGGRGTGANPSHTFDSAGIYNVTVSATDVHGLTGTATTMVNVSSKPSQLPSFKFDFGPGGSPVAPGYTGVGTAAYSSGVGYGWQSSSGIYADSNWWPDYSPVTASLVYSSDNTFLVDLPDGSYTVVPTLGRYSAGQSQVALSLNGRQVASGLATAPEQVISPAYQVDVTNGQLAVHVQNTSGQYFWLDALSILPGQVQPPTVSAGPAITAVVGEPADFGQATAGGTGPLGYNWYFGDYSTSSTPTAAGTLDPAHVYQAAGTYTAMLTVTDANGLVVASPVTVAASPATVPVSNNVPPTVTLTAPSVADVNAPVSFVASATEPSASAQGAGFTYTWDFGDGTTATGANPSHTFGAIGNYTVSVTATDTLDQQGTATAVIDVLAPIVVDVPNPSKISAGQPLTVNEGSSVAFIQATASGTGPLTYRWDFGDGSQLLGALNPSHVYKDNGTYTSTLTVTDSNGLTTASSVAVTVNNVAPTASVNVPATGTAGLPIGFSASATDLSPTDQAAGFSYAWNFGDGTTGSGVTPVHSYAAPGTYTVSVTATDRDGAASSKAVGSIVVSAPTTPGSTVNLTSDWFQQQGSGPYLLNQANTTYVLQTDVTTTGTAFVVLAPNVTLNLNGHTVTYGNSQPVVVPNGGFESGSGMNVPGWDIRKAPAAALAPNTNYLFGNQVLRLSNFSTPQTIVSGTIPISLLNHTYEATITPGDLNVTYGTSVTISVIDSVTGEVLGTGSSANTQRGFSAIAAFTPVTTNPVRLQVVVTPPAGVTTSLDLDAATLGVSYDYGIVASGLWSGEFQGYANLPAAVQNAYAANYLKVANFTVENGSITQGQGDGTNSSPLFFKALNGLTVDKITTYDTGLDTKNLDGQYARGNIIISNSTFQDNIPNVTNRMAGPATISFYNTNGNIRIEGNRILGSPQYGIGVDTNNGYTLAINDNYISQNAIVGDAAGIGVVAVSNFQIKGNTIVPQSGEGIAVDGFRSTGSNNGVIQNNYIKTQERPTRESGSRTYGRALRMRNDVDLEGPQTNIDVSGNTFISMVGPGYSQNAYTVWFSYANNNGAMNNANVNLHDNVIQAIANTADPSYHALALVLDQVDSGINMTIRNNVLESNDVSLALGGYNDGNINGVTLFGNTLSKLTDAPARSYVGIQAGYWQTQVSNVKILDTALENGATANVNAVGLGTKSFQIGTTLNLQVQDGNGSAASGATVQIFDGNGTLLYQGATDNQGLLSAIPVTLTTYAQSGDDPAATTTTSSGPLTIQVTNGTRKKSLVINPSPNEDLSILMVD